MIKLIIASAAILASISAPAFAENISYLMTLEKVASEQNCQTMREKYEQLLNEEITLGILGTHALSCQDATGSSSQIRAQMILEPMRESSLPALLEFKKKYENNPFFFGNDFKFAKIKNFGRETEVMAVKYESDDYSIGNTLYEKTFALRWDLGRIWVFNKEFSKELTAFGDKNEAAYLALLQEKLGNEEFAILEKVRPQTNTINVIHKLSFELESGEVVPFLLGGLSAGRDCRIQTGNNDCHL